MKERVINSETDPSERGKLMGADDRVSKEGCRKGHTDWTASEWGQCWEAEASPGQLSRSQQDEVL